MSGPKEASHLGGPAWRKDCRKYSEELQKTKSIASADLLFGCITLFIAKSLSAQAVQTPETARLIETLEALACKVMIFTARGRSGENAWYKLCVSGVDTLTKEQLEQSNIGLRQNQASPEHPNVFEGRMIFSQNQPKEDLLSELIEKKIIDLSQYHQVIFADDKKDSVTKLGAFFKTSQILYTGIHYTRVENVEKEEYEPMKSTIHLAHLFEKHVLPTPQELENIQIQLKEQGVSAEDFFKQTLIKIDNALDKEGVYQEKGLDTEQLFDRIKQASARSL